MIKKCMLMCAILVQAFCLTMPESSSFDKKITFSVFNPNDVLQIHAANGYVTVIEFARNERIINVATGFSDGWDITDKENLLFIKPKAIVTKLIQSPSPESTSAKEEMIVDPNWRWRTNLIVTTNLNFYVFDLTIGWKKRIYKMSFTYPNIEKDGIEKAKARLKQEIDKQKLVEALNRPSVPRNWDYVMKVNKGSDDITPNFAYDDGVFTYLGFDNTKTFPSAFSYENEQESILNTHIKHENNFTVLVIQKITKQILLRSGDKLVGIFNKSYAKNPLDRTPQTSNDDEVVRELRNGRQ